MSLDKVIQLRIYFENKNYKTSKKEIAELISLHKDLMEKAAPLLKNKVIFYKGKVIAVDYQRIVCGAHGPYVEFSEGDFSCELVIPEDQKWRMHPQYLRNIKYIHMSPKERMDLKVYKQRKPVSYADYKPHLYYIDFWAIHN